MKILPFLNAVAIAGAASSVAFAGSSTLPPMNQFNDAFYSCGDGQAFQMSYDSTTPQSAVMTTSNNNHEYQLKKQSVSGAAQFSNGTVTFWTDGQQVRVAGTKTPLAGCKLTSS